MDRVSDERRARLQEIERLTSGPRRMSRIGTQALVIPSSQQRHVNEEIDCRVLRRIEILSRIGRGAYGIVWKGIERRGSSYPRKIIALKKCFNAFASSSDAQRTYREISYLQILSNHVNIIQLRKVIRPKNELDVYLVFEFMDTDLHALIRANLLEEIHKKYIAYQLFKALKYMHSANVVHRDIKPSNILLQENGHMKLCDLGLCRSISTRNEDQLWTDQTFAGFYTSNTSNITVTSGNDDSDDTIPTIAHTTKVIDSSVDQQSTGQREYYVATRWYRAPESLLGSSLCLPGLDIWAAACIIGEMYHGAPILPGESTTDQIYRILELLCISPDDDNTYDSNQQTNDSQHNIFAKKNCSRPESPIVTRLRHVLIADSYSDDQKSSTFVDWFLSEDGGEDARPLCAKMFRLDPQKRTSARDALSHPWLKVFQGREPEPEFSGDSSLKLAVPDDILLNAAEYRQHIFRDLLNYKTKSRVGGGRCLTGGGTAHLLVKTDALPEDDDESHEFASSLVEPSSAHTETSQLFPPHSNGQTAVRLKLSSDSDSNAVSTSNLPVSPSLGAQFTTVDGDDGDNDEKIKPTECFDAAAAATTTTTTTRNGTSFLFCPPS